MEVLNKIRDGHKNKAGRFKIALSCELELYNKNYCVEFLSALNSLMCVAKSASVRSFFKLDLVPSPVELEKT